MHVTYKLTDFCSLFKPGAAGHSAWFLKINPVRIVSMCVRVSVCVSAPEAINN